MLVTSKQTRRWVIPKGNVKNGLTAAQSAVEEAFEEAGIRGLVDLRAVGIYRYRKSPGLGSMLCEVRVYPLKVLFQHPRWPEQAQRRRQWVSLEHAARMVRETQLRRILLVFHRRLLRMRSARP